MILPRITRRSPVLPVSANQRLMSAMVCFPASSPQNCVVTYRSFTWVSTGFALIKTPHCGTCFKVPSRSCRVMACGVVFTTTTPFLKVSYKYSIIFLLLALCGACHPYDRGCLPHMFYFFCSRATQAVSSAHLPELKTCTQLPFCRPPHTLPGRALYQRGR